MCGRFTLRTPAKELVEVFGIAEVPDELHPRFNVAPSQGVAAVRLDEGGTTLSLSFLKWGLVPGWAKSPDDSFRPINAKCETVATLASFRDSFKKKRCLVPADGFFEWKAEGKAKQPYHFRLKSHAAFAFAGLWSEWKGGDEPLLTAAIITTEANEVVAPVHARMPVILPHKAFKAWLDPKTTADELKSLLVPYSAGKMEAVAVSKLVNSPKNDVAEVLNTT